MSKIDKISYRIFLLIVFLSPILFIPTLAVLLDFSKVALIVFGFSIILGLNALSFFKKSLTPLPRGPVAWAMAGILISMLVSTIVSPSWLRSLVAQGYETTSLIFVLTMFVVTYVTCITLSSKHRITGLVAALLGGYSVVAVIQVIRLIVSADSFTLGVFSTFKTMTLFGSWFDMALWSVIALIVSMGAITYKIFNPRMHKIMYCVYGLSLILLIVVNAYMAWLAIVVTAIIYIIFAVKNKELRVKLRRVESWLIVVPAIIAVIFMFNSSGSISTKIYGVFKIPSNTLQFNRVALSLPLKETLSLASDVLSSKPIFGAQPMRFQHEYFKHKPAIVNSSDSWAIEFFSGYGYILTSITEQGIIGILFWALLLYGLIALIIKALKVAHGEEDKFSKFSLTTSALISAAGIIILATFMPAQPMMFAIFLSFGWLMASLVLVGKFNIKPASTPMKNKIFAVIILILAVLVIVIFGRKTLASMYFNAGTNGVSNSKPNVDVAHAAFKKAASIEPLDVNYQALAQLAIYSASNKLNSIPQDQATGQAVDQKTKDLIASVQDNIAESVTSAKAAVTADPQSYYNYLTEARISAALISVQVQNAKENAIRAYADAITLNPSSPALLLERAQLSYDLSDWAGAKEFIGKATAMRPNYIEAVFLLTQVQVKEGSIDAAITSATQALNLNPNLPILNFQLGLLRYYNKEYTQAVEALQKAIVLTPDYSNAHYFLGLTYSKLGQVEEAVKEFEVVQSYNPDNAEIKTILANLRSGKAPFPSGTPAVKLPITEKAKK